MTARPDRIAIVGIGGLFPGSENLDGFWRQIAERSCAAGPVPEGRWNIPIRDAVGDGDPQHDAVASARGCFVDERGLPVPRETDGLDPLFRIGTAAAHRAFADARGAVRAPERTGVIIGNIVLPSDQSSRVSERIYGGALERALFGQGTHSTVGSSVPIRVHDELSVGLAARLIAADLGLGGTAYTVDAACASSLYALRLACAELTSGRADAMLTGGLSRPSSLYTQMGFTQLKALSPEGLCTPFGAAGKGLVVGEGAGMFVIKRLADALADGDQIYATIAGIGLSNDIGGSLLAPDSDGQLLAMRQAYDAAGWRPGSVDLIECHATGTPLGDAVEVESLRRLWAQEEWRRGQCVIGSVKSNVGHLLTAAGAAGLAKVLLALRHRLLPATANTEEPAPGLRLSESPFRLLTAGEDWPETAGRPRRAAISAFGFGGINAHVLLEEWRADHATPNCMTHQTPVDLAIVARSARVGPWQTAAAVDRRLLGLDATEPATWTAPARVGGPAPHPPRGFFIDALQVPLGRFRIPPAEFAAMLPQQLLTLLTSADAADDARWQQQWGPRAGTFVGLDLDMETGAFSQRWSMPARARRWNVEHDLGLDEAALGVWVQQLRETVAPALDAEHTLGALGGIVASRLAREFRISGPSFTVSAQENSGLKALEAAAHCLRSGLIDRALVAAVDLPGDRVAAAAEISGVAPTELVAEGAVAFIIRRLEDAVADGDHIYAVLPADDKGATSQSMRAASLLGHCGAAHGLLEVYAAAMLLNRGLRAPDRPWPQDRLDEAPRLSVVVSGDRVVVSAPPPPRKPVLRDSWALSGAAELPMLFSGGQRHELAAALRSAADPDADLPELARRLWRDRSGHPMRLGIAARDRAGLAASVAHAGQLLAGHDSADPVSQRRFGVYFDSDPLLRQRPDGLAFAFPGSGNHSLGMGRSWALAFPDVIARQERENQFLRSQLQPELFWDETDPAVLNERFEDLILGQVAFGCIGADILALLGVRPAAVLGYSLGESAGLLAMRVWRDRDEMLQQIRASSLFSQDMAGELRAVRTAWALPDDAPTPRWQVGIVDRSATAVAAALASIERAYLLIVNTPGECVIGGDPDAVAAAVETLEARFFPLKGITAVHCDVARPVAAAYRELHRRPTEASRDLRFYSGASGQAYHIDSESVADSLLNQAILGVDFPATVRRAYDDGARVFIEVGPGASGTRMIGEILRGSRFAAWSIADPSRVESDSLLHAALGLDAEGYPVDFAPLFDRIREKVAVRERRSVDVNRWRAARTAPAPPVGLPRREPSVAATRRPISAPITAELANVEEKFALLVRACETSAAAQLSAHSAYLALSSEVTTALANATARRMALVGITPAAAPDAPDAPAAPAAPAAAAPPVFMDRPACLEYAVGSIGKVLGPDFTEADRFPTRVRLPDEPLMLVDRIVQVDAEPRSMSTGRVITEHDVRPDAWYLDGNRIPTFVAVEAGQADLFLSGYLGVDFQTRGEAVYRLLDARVTFHRGLPEPGLVIRYDITIDGFFRHGDMILFRFGFDSTVNGEPLMSMREGCAGFFTKAELAAGKGLIRTRLQTMPRRGIEPNGQTVFVPMGRARYDDAALAMLRRGDLAGCFGPDFAGLPLVHPRTIPGAQPDSRLRLLDRVTDLELPGGRFGLGRIRAELDIHPDDWFLVCHFSDDQVMPGTLMYECCLHTLRVFLLRQGWVGEEDDFICEPKPGVAGQLRCRGQVVSTTTVAAFEVEIKELGFDPDAYAVADAVIYADRRAIVEIVDMSVRLTGLRQARLEEIWGARKGGSTSGPAFGPERILAYAIGSPSEAFGEPYRVFDHDRVLARLPGPPYLFLDRIVAIEGCRPWVLEAGATVVGEYDVPANAWYFAENTGQWGDSRLPAMPFAVLLEIALQPCGWLAAYLGSALTSPIDLSFRNLGGAARQLIDVHPDAGTLTTRVTLTRVSASGGMIIQNYDLAVYAGAHPVYVGDTYFGFFSKAALAQQVGLGEVRPYRLTAAEEARASYLPVLREPGPCGDMLTMLDEVEQFVEDGGPAGLGFLRGVKRISSDEWFFAAHFYQDPVWPGSLGLEAFLQLLRIAAQRRWPNCSVATALGTTHTWVYRGQVLPTDSKVRVEASVTAIDDDAGLLTANGLLEVDGRVIYQMIDFEVRRS
jgi:acyl transferase domain-containing protein/3-hydroxymyristoyl/3-hydroxydecanoyl-(acyl carrier protein) dehydratase